ncbi:hypothetical protein SEA_BURRO_35 [Microbacterium phage Burro]|uniref:Uncharacterized protein n=1 Tax=Microbacterium phage Burro TaxID=2315703 RepID=A0A386KKJ1_9CAUD|nr:hypothetical protein HWB89_gp35 [Microbacterium phage Burro]AYD86178.1 hypothetical protein SEA_BURRO_35 [Microbacterium phage Burro]
MTEEQMPLWARQFQGEMLRGLQGVQNTLATVVTKESFRDEKDRVNAELTGLRGESQSIRDALNAESTARQTSELAAAKKVAEEATARQKVQAATNWQWFALIAIPFGTKLVDWLLGGTGP